MTEQESADTAKPRIDRTRIVTVALAVLVGLLVIALGWFGYARFLAPKPTAERIIGTWRSTTTTETLTFKPDGELVFSDETTGTYRVIDENDLSVNQQGASGIVPIQWRGSDILDLMNPSNPTAVDASYARVK